MVAVTAAAVHALEAWCLTVTRLTACVAASLTGALVNQHHPRGEHPSPFRCRMARARTSRCQPEYAPCLRYRNEVPSVSRGCCSRRMRRHWRQRLLLPLQPVLSSSAWQESVLGKPYWCPPPALASSLAPRRVRCRHPHHPHQHHCHPPRPAVERSDAKKPHPCACAWTTGP